MNLTILSFILLFFSFYSILKRLFAFIHKEQGQSLFKLLVTVVIWSGISYTAFFPNQIKFISQKLGFGENLNTLIFFGFVITFMILFRLLAILEKNEKLITHIIRKDALKGITRL